MGIFKGFLQFGGKFINHHKIPYFIIGFGTKKGCKGIDPFSEMLIQAVPYSGSSFLRFRICM